MDRNNRKLPPVQRGSVDGIRPRLPINNKATTTSNEPEKQETQATNLPQEKSLQQQKNQPSGKKRSNWIIIIASVLVFIGLSALAIYAKLSADQPDNDTNLSQAEPAAEETKADNADLIEQTINEIDQLTNKSDTSGEGLSDEKLGL